MIIDGELNIVHALSSTKPVEEIEEDFHIHLKSIELIGVDIYKLNESNNLIVESFVDHAELSFKSNDEHVLASIGADMEMNVIKDGDTTFFKHKHLSIDSEVEYLKEVYQFIHYVNIVFCTSNLTISKVKSVHAVNTDYYIIDS